MNIYFCFYFNIARDAVTVLLVCVNIHHFNHTLSHAHTEADAHKHKCMINTQEKWRQPGTGAWMGGAEERFSTPISQIWGKKVRANRASSYQTICYGVIKANQSNQTKHITWLHHMMPPSITSLHTLQILI